MSKKLLLILFSVLLAVSFLCSSDFAAAQNTGTQPDPIQKRMELYRYAEAATQIPWYYYAGADQYELNLREARSDLDAPAGHIGFYISPEKWTGALNPNPDDENPKTISFFGGIGTDGDGDGKASRSSDMDLIHTFAGHMSKYGTEEENIRIALWNYYNRDKAVGIIIGNAHIFKKFGRIDLRERAFPVPVRSDYTFNSTWGSARGWGGKRIHEGTDIFAGYGLPVRATCYGIIEMKGWNRYGGWRIGIRDIGNTYHYFAHLNGFAKGIEAGQIVEPGMVIGGVGSSGYGPPGTAGKFPPHLHFGMYKDNGYTEWSFDPYPHLKLWQRKELAKK